MMKNKKLLYGILVIILIVVGAFLLLNKPTQKPVVEISSFDECAKAGYPIGESYPRQCWTPDGRRFVEKVVTKITCTDEAKVCPDGSTVGRNPALNCQFDPCPSSGPTPCPPGQVQESGLAGIPRCATESNISCTSNAQCPQGEECKSGGGAENFRCTGRIFGCWGYPDGRAVCAD